MLSSGLVVAEENDAFSSRTVAAAEAGFNLAYSNDQMSARAIGERTVDLLGSFDLSDSGQSSRYCVELDVENEDSDWSFEATVTIEF